MTENQNVVIATENFLVREGLRGILRTAVGFSLAGECTQSTDLLELLLTTHPKVLVINYTDSGFDLSLVKKVNRYFPETHILAITPIQPRQTVSKAIAAGIISHLLTNCEKDEILEAIVATSRGEKFFCGKILNQTMNEKGAESSGSFSCNGVRISSREVEIIQLVAEGLTNKAIADKLCLSSHTIMTHRKNIMAKIGVNNTASLVLFAIKNGLVPQDQFLLNPTPN
ncbi:MAG: response regulator transcription factor [Bacteroidia bacterium]|nr:response regulator transcription factor [Bacteroidia bacterium]